MNLTSKQKAFLKSEAHDLSPIFQIGKNGLSHEQISQINSALEKRELIKISLLQNTSETPKEVANMISEKTNANVIQVIGRVIVLFKKSANKEHQDISAQL